MSSDRTARRREIEDSTAARLAEIVAAAEQAAKRVIDEAEEEARARLDGAHEEADRIVAARLGALAELTDEIGAQAEALRRQAEALQRALAEAKDTLGGADAPAPRPSDVDFERDAPRPAGPALTVVGGLEREPAPRPEPPGKADGAPVPPGSEREGARAHGTPAGARLLATQMAVSGSSRAEIETRLRDGFAITDTRAILDAILGPEQ